MVNKCQIILLFLLGIPLLYCKPPSVDETQSNEEFSIPDSILRKATIAMEEAEAKEIIQNIASPVEMAILVKEAGTPYSTKYLCDIDLVKNYTTNFKKAIAVGVLGTNIGYLNINHRLSLITNYITELKRISDDLKIGQFIDVVALKELAEMDENLDSLIYASVSQINQMDTYLRKNNRSDIAVLIVTGVWLESLYLGTQSTIENPDERVIERIGEQKIIITELLKILSHFENLPNFDELISDLKVIEECYQPVKITYMVGKPETKTVHGKLIIIPNEISTVHITDEQLAEIIRVLARIRNKTLSGQ